jgi:hypothetical protein
VKRWALAGLLLSASASPAAAQNPTFSVFVPAASGDSLLEVNPAFVVQVTASPTGDAIRTVTLQIDDAPDFRTLVAEFTENGSSMSVRPSRPLPHASPLFWRVIARTATETFLSEVTGPRRSAPWIRLVSPNRPSGSFLSTRRPTFVWRAARVTNPPGPWRFDLEVLNVSTRQTVRSTGLADTVFLSPFELQFNTSYRWSVTAYLGSPDSVRVESAGSFVIVDELIPRVNLLYQNFPNPFPTVQVNHTCIWFDLKEDQRVTLEVLDLRGNRVRTIVPANGFGPFIPAGRYGRAEIDGSIGCDPRLTWDGSTNDGRMAHPGVYLLRFRAGETESILKMLFRGR